MKSLKLSHIFHKIPKIIYILILVISVTLNVYLLITIILWNEFSPDHDGRIFTNRTNMCVYFAQSYLRTIHETEKMTTASGEKWEGAIAI